MLHMAEPFLEKNVHPTVIVRGYVKALEDAIKIVDELSFPIDTNDKTQMLKIVNSCIGTKFTNQFGNLMAVCWCIQSTYASLLAVCILLHRCCSSRLLSTVGHNQESYYFSLAATGLTEAFCAA